MLKLTVVALNRAWGVPSCRLAPFWLTSTAMICCSGEKKKSSLPSFRQFGLDPPAVDTCQRPVMNRQCLSFLSFKLDNDNRLMLTAVYRNHYYVERLLGNLIGLARLMAFVSNEAGVPVASSRSRQKARARGNRDARFPFARCGQWRARGPGTDGRRAR
jgi:hypothetical protein